MITYINAKNAEDYQILFSKAAAVLKTAQPHVISESLAQQGLTWDDFAIGSLNEYFAYLEDIMAATSGDQQKFFVRLPLDEDVFAINADTRTISVPANFNRAGVGVQGDEMAEVVYFTIDRFFDSMDLANAEMNIAIQWEAKNAAKETISGISKNFGKDIESIPGKIIFGWPISSELTQTSGTIKFAVRFYMIDTIDEVRQFTYSFTTLPAEIAVNASLDYDIVNSAVREIDHGQVITGRIRSSGIYDTGAERPEDPTITVPLYVMTPEGNEANRIVDLPLDNSGVTLAIAAKPTTSGIIVYDWKKFVYDTDSGNYSATASALPEGDNITVAHVEVTEDIEGEAVNGRYYRLINGAYELISLRDFEEDDGVYHHSSNGFRMIGSSNFIKLYKELSVATVHSVGKYAVDVEARVLANRARKEMDEVDAITIPGPLKPYISFPIGAVVTENVDHIISDDGESVGLMVIAEPGEEGKSAEEVGEHPQVTLEYNWKQVINGVEVPVIAEPAVMPVTALPAGQLPDDPEWQENATEDGVSGAKGIFNQENVDIVVNGATIIVYPRAELKSFESTNASQGVHQWLALDINTGLDTIEGSTWEDSYTFEAADENELGVANGHILFWLKVDEALDGAITRKVNDTVLTFRASMEQPTDATYSIDENRMTIVGLSDAQLDKTYRVEVTATRNGISTTGVSGDYRITHSPEKPVIKIREFDPNTNQFRLVRKDYMSSNNIERVAIRPHTMSFSVEPPAQSDTLSYIWMRINADANIASDWEGAAEKLQVDLDNAIEGLAAIIGNPEGEADFPVEGSPIATARKYLNSLHDIGDAASEEFEDNGPKYTVNENSPAGYYYCVVINELNGHINANVSPFFQVS